MLFEIAGDLPLMEYWTQLPKPIRKAICRLLVYFPFDNLLPGTIGKLLSSRISLF
jgi:hypothetical protein